MTTTNKPSAAALRIEKSLRPHPGRDSYEVAERADAELQPLIEALEACVQAGVIPNMDSLPRTPTEIGNLAGKVHTALKRARGEE